MKEFNKGNNPKVITLESDNETILKTYSTDVLISETNADFNIHNDDKRDMFFPILQYKAAQKIQSVNCNVQAKDNELYNDPKQSTEDVGHSHSFERVITAMDFFQKEIRQVNSSLNIVINPYSTNIETPNQKVEIFKYESIFNNISSTADKINLEIDFNKDIKHSQGIIVKRRNRKFNIFDHLNTWSYFKPRNLDIVINMISNVEIVKPKVYLQASREQLMDERNRILTFTNFPRDSPKFALQLAQSGFVYIGSGKYKDEVKCNFCKTTKYNWKPCDIIEKVHRKKCPMKTKKSSRNRPVTLEIYNSNIHQLAEKFVPKQKNSLRINNQVQSKHLTTMKTLPWQFAIKEVMKQNKKRAAAHSRQSLESDTIYKILQESGRAENAQSRVASNVGNFQSVKKERNNASLAVTPVDNGSGLVNSFLENASHSAHYTQASEEVTAFASIVESTQVSGSFSDVSEISSSPNPYVPFFSANTLKTTEENFFGASEVITNTAQYSGVSEVSSNAVQYEVTFEEVTAHPSFHQPTEESESVIEIADSTEASFSQNPDETLVPTNPAEATVETSLNALENLEMSAEAGTSSILTQHSGESITAPRSAVLTEPLSSTSRSRNRGPTYEQLGIITDRPKRVEYALRPKRLETFSTWPRNHHISPEELAEAGFYFAGYGDCARCFFCGGGLRNWDEEDDVRVEHARWFPRCAFIRQLMGQVFVDTVESMNTQYDKITMAMVMEKLGEAHASFQLAPSIMTAPLKRDAAVQSVLTLGFLENDVEEVAQRIKQEGETLSADLIVERLKLENKTSMQPQRNLGLPSTDMKTAQDLMRTLKEKNTQLRQLTSCKICMDREVAVVFLPCGHLVSCADCSSAMRQCPYCRLDVRGIVRAFMG